MQKGGPKMVPCTFFEASPFFCSSAGIFILSSCFSLSRKDAMSFGLPARGEARKEVVGYPEMGIHVPGLPTF